MKKQAFKFGFKRFIVLSGLVSVLTVTSSISVKATNKNTVPAESTIQYVGTNEKGIVFNVKYDNPTETKFNLTIKNEVGDIVFMQQYTDKNFDKKIILAKEPGEAHVIFSIKSASTDYKQSFDISTTTKEVEEVVVKTNNTY